MLQRWEGPDLRVVLVDLIENGLVRGFAEATLLSGLQVVLESGTESLRAIIEGISKRLVNTFYGVSTSHEDLEDGQYILLRLERVS